MEEMLVHFGDLVIEQSWIKEIDINPLFASADDLIALDARVVLYEPEVQAAELPRLAIRPYPAQYVKPFITKKGDYLLIRPIRPEDEPKVVEYHKGISEKSVYLRYFRALQYDQRVAHERLVRICHADYDREVVLVAERDDEESGESKIVGIGRLTRAGSSTTAEYAILISDAYQGHGLGTELLRRLLAYGREEGIKRVEAYILAENRGMLHISEKLGFSFKREGETIKATIEL
jgi:acetyltransferase